MVFQRFVLPKRNHQGVLEFSREIMVARYGVSVCLIKIFLRFGVAGLKVETKGIIFMDALGFFCKAVLRIENFISVKIPSANLLGWPRSKRRVKNCNFLNSKDSLTEFVLSRRKASPFTKPFLTLRG